MGEREYSPLSASDSHNAAMSAEIAEVVKRLVDILGLSLVAAIAGMKETRAVSQWTTGRREPQQPQRLRFALQLALMIAENPNGVVPRAWFQGSNPHLGDRSPALMLRTMPLEEIQGDLMAAARSFAAR